MTEVVKRILIYAGIYHQILLLLESKLNLVIGLL
jgi:hypothetical protein